MALKASELRELTVEELETREQELADQLFALRVQKVTGQLEIPAKVSQTKRDLARVLTVLNEKHRESQGSEE
jgi:large subunit ribosomal protein L29